MDVRTFIVVDLATSVILARSRNRKIAARISNSLENTFIATVPASTFAESGAGPLTFSGAPADGAMKAAAAAGVPAKATAAGSADQVVRMAGAPSEDLTAKMSLARARGKFYSQIRRAAKQAEAIRQAPSSAKTAKRIQRGKGSSLTSESARNLTKQVTVAVTSEDFRAIRSALRAAKITTTG